MMHHLHSLIHLEPANSGAERNHLRISRKNNEIADGGFTSNRFLGVGYGPNQEAFTVLDLMESELTLYWTFSYITRSMSMCCRKY